MDQITNNLLKKWARHISAVASRRGRDGIYTDDLHTITK